ncbi:V-type ATP synthase subunit I [Caloramator mitchellensis]|uniref:V-type ATP synthase subunit I n=1 Tax=Caloramator mitchellensis TaxID=908809 RepID=A0A0R3K4P7_CALMK|nr:V-type ATP synthase subunit I [Caloramator mitchellensis]KRQ87327.1 V-type ATP synthase subunit I [Caloramator mitchellensis]
MAIVRMKKISIVAPKEDRDGLLKLIQRLGTVQLINIEEQLEDVELKTEKVNSEAEYRYSKIKFTYEFLKAYSDVKKGLFTKKKVLSLEDFENLNKHVNWEEIYEKCKSIEDEINSVNSRISKIESQIIQYSDWINLDVNLVILEGLKNISYFIGTINKKFKDSFLLEFNEKFKDAYFEIINEKQSDVNLFAIVHKNIYDEVFEVLKKYGYTKLNIELDKTPSQKIDEFNSEIQALKARENELKLEAKKLTEKIDEVESIYDYIYSELLLEQAKAKVAGTNKTVIFTGWIPENEVEKATNAIYTKFRHIYIDLEDGDQENAPVQLKNSWIVEPFEVVTSMYALPKTNEVDPTPILTPFFLLFFGMMMADIGYGLMMMAVSIVLLKFTSVEGDLKKLAKLILYCSFPTILFGFLYGSFFGGIIPITPLWLNPVDRPMDVLTFSIVFGLIHLYVGLGVKAYRLIRDGKVKDAFFDVGAWYLLLSGLIWMGLGGGNIAKIIAILGAAIILLTHGRENKTIVGKFFGGFYSLYGVTGYLGDALSYSRLLALGLASGLIGWSFNLLIELLGGGITALIFGPIIFIAGHTFNFLIGLLGVYVHTSRLQYLEFFGKFYEGGGKAFEPLRIKTKFIKVE